MSPPIHICFRSAGQFSKLVAEWIFSKDSFVPTVGGSHGFKFAFLCFGLMFDIFDVRTLFVV